MEQNHRDEITNTYNFIENVRTKTFTLKQFNDLKDNLDIIDPYYSSYGKYKEILKIIDFNVEKAILKIKKMNSPYNY